SALAHVPPMQALLSSCFVPLAYLFFGASPGLAVGPEASASIITGLAVQSAIDSGQFPYLTASQLATSLALLAGIAAVAMAILRAGFVDQILSGFLLTGFVLGTR
ncbi:hypothetical protein HK405_011657, partial [Cladochytrium tenue]